MKQIKDINLKPTMDVKSRKMNASSIVKNAVTVGTKKFAWIPVDLLNIKPYQRGKENHLKNIFENWDDSKYAALWVSYDEENGWFNILDGQHRATAARMRGIDFLVCEICTDMNTSKEALRFVEANINSKKLSPFDTYKANLYIADEDDTELSKVDKRIAKICDQYGIEVKKSEACGVLRSVPHVRKIIKKEGEDCLRFVFDVIQGSHWDSFKNGYSYTVVEALRKIYVNYMDNLDFAKERLCNYLVKSSPRQIDTIGNSKYSNLGRTGRWDAVLAQIVA